MSVVYKVAKEVEEVALPLIKKYHPHLLQINIGYLFRSEASVMNDPMGGVKVVAGRAVKVDDRNYVFGSMDAMIEIAQDVWERLSPELRVVLVDHELCHIGVKLVGEKNAELTDQGRPRIGMIPHDMEEFECILERYGDTHRLFRKHFRDLNDEVKKAKANKNAK